MPSLPSNVEITRFDRTCFRATLSLRVCRNVKNEYRFQKAPVALSNEVMYRPGLVASLVRQTRATHRKRDLPPQKMLKPGTFDYVNYRVFLLPRQATTVLNKIHVRRNFHYRDRHTFLRLYKHYVCPLLYTLAHT